MTETKYFPSVEELMKLAKRVHNPEAIRRSLRDNASMLETLVKNMSYKLSGGIGPDRVLEGNPLLEAVDEADEHICVTTMPYPEWLPKCKRMQLDEEDTWHPHLYWSVELAYQDAPCGKDEGKRYFTGLDIVLCVDDYPLDDDDAGDTTQFEWRIGEIPKSFLISYEDEIQQAFEDLITDGVWSACIRIFGFDGRNSSKQQ
jgi:hypothetical protein